MPAKRAKSQLNIWGVLLLILVAAIYLYSEPTEQKADTPSTPLPASSVPLQPATAIPATATKPAAAQAPTQPPARLAWLNLHFTNPDTPEENEAYLQHVLEKINNATQSIDAASFDLNLPALVEALIAAQKRGVEVRVVYDGENGNNDLDVDGDYYESIPLLKKAKIDLQDGGRSSGLMHNKMLIIDRQLLFIGSWNLSYNDTYRNNNNILEVTDPDLIANYQAKFDEMFEQELFGRKAEMGALQTDLNLPGASVQNYFSPADDIMPTLIGLVESAQTSIRFMAFTYTDPNLAQAMITRAEEGVTVEGIIENRGASQGAFVNLACANLPVRTDANKYTMHHKVIIIDESIVITGSYNFTKSANENNDDNVIILHSPQLASQYLQEFNRLYPPAEPANLAELECP